MKPCKTAIDKLSEPKLGPKPRNESIEQTYYQDELAFCWSLDDHEPDLNPDLTYQNLDISHQKHGRDSRNERYRDSLERRIKGKKYTKILFNPKLSKLFIFQNNKGIMMQHFMQSYFSMQTRFQRVRT